MSKKAEDGICPRCKKNSWVLNYSKGFYQSVCTHCGYEEVQTEVEWHEHTRL